MNLYSSVNTKEIDVVANLNSKINWLITCPNKKLLTELVPFMSYFFLDRYFFLYTYIHTYNKVSTLNDGLMDLIFTLLFAHVLQGCRLLYLTRFRNKVRLMNRCMPLRWCSMTFCLRLVIMFNFAHLYVCEACEVQR